MQKITIDIPEAYQKALREMRGHELPQPQATPERPYKFVPHNHKGMVEFSIGQEVWLIDEGHIFKTVIVGVYFDRGDTNPDTRIVKYDLLGMAGSYHNSQLCHSLSALVENFTIDHTQNGE